MAGQGKPNKEGLNPVTGYAMDKNSDYGMVSYSSQSAHAVFRSRARESRIDTS